MVKFAIAILLAALFFIAVMVIDNHRFVVRRYHVCSRAVKRPVRIVFIADLHEKDYGNGNGELAEAIANQEKSIKECRLQIREAELQVKEYEKVLEGRVVRATMDGVVTSAGTMEEEPDSGPFILVSGKAGLYVQGTISEMELDSIQVGDTITGMSYDTGNEFTAEITEISPYPSDSTRTISSLLAVSSSPSAAKRRLASPT